jgi:hypothetical protein
MMAVLAGLSVACSGLNLSNSPLEDVTAEEANRRHYMVPNLAKHVYVKDFSALDVRSTWFRYELPQDEFDSALGELATSEEHERIHTWSVPESWPDFSGFGKEAEAPSWWAPHGTEVFRRVRASEGVDGQQDVAYVSQQALNPKTRTVHVWMWEWQWWTE